MGCVPSTTVDDEANARNDKIVSQLAKDRLLANNEIKMLFLGTGKLGKSRLFRQMQLIHHGGYNDAERCSYKEIIYSNTIQSMQYVLEALPELKLTLAPSKEVHRTTILSFPAHIKADVLPCNVVDAVRSLWSDPGVQEAAVRPDSQPL